MSQPDCGFYRSDPPVQHSAPPDPPAYGPPPGHGTPWYGPAPGYGAPGPGFPLRRPTNSTAVLALVFAFVFAPVGLVLGIAARRQIRRTGEEGDGLALAGIVIGSIAVTFYAALAAIWVVAFVSLTSYR